MKVNELIKVLSKYPSDYDVDLSSDYRLQICSESRNEIIHIDLEDSDYNESYCESASYDDLGSAPFHYLELIEQEAVYEELEKEYMEKVAPFWPKATDEQRKLVQQRLIQQIENQVCPDIKLHQLRKIA